MAQVKIYGLKTHLENRKNEISKTIHQTLVDILKLPKEKKFHRFISFEQEMMIFPSDKSDNYTIIEIMMMEGRSKEVKKKLIQNLFINLEQKCRIDPNDIEICIIESPASNWGFRGKCGDDITLSYKVDI